MFIPVRFFSFLHLDPHGGHQRLRATRPQPPDWKWMEPGNVRRTTARLFRAGHKRPKGEGGARFDVAGRIPSPWSPLQPSSTPAKAPFRQRNPEDCRHAPVRLPVRVRSAFRPHFHPLTETSSPHAGFPASFPALPLSGRIGAASPEPPAAAISHGRTLPWGPVVRHSGPEEFGFPAGAATRHGRCIQVLARDWEPYVKRAEEDASVSNAWISERRPHRCPRASTVYGKGRTGY